MRQRREAGVEPAGEQHVAGGVVGTDEGEPHLGDRVEPLDALAVEPGLRRREGDVEIRPLVGRLRPGPRADDEHRADVVPLLRPCDEAALEVLERPDLHDPHDCSRPVER
jgi:hypothetical protein